MAKAKKSSAGEPPAAEMAALKLGELIRAKRKARTWTQADLGDRLGMHRAYVSQIETGKKGWPQSYIGKIALALDMRPSELGRAAGWIVDDDEYDPETGEPVPGSPVRRLAAERSSGVVALRRLSPLARGRRLGQRGGRADRSVVALGDLALATRRTGDVARPRPTDAQRAGQPVVDAGA
jgi:transcriptional regulator with XRE-family HTH domain